MRPHPTSGWNGEVAGYLWYSTFRVEISLSGVWARGAQNLQTKWTAGVVSHLLCSQRRISHCQVISLRSYQRTFASVRAGAKIVITFSFLYARCDLVESAHFASLSTFSQFHGFRFVYFSCEEQETLAPIQIPNGSKKACLVCWRMSNLLLPAGLEDSVFQELIPLCLSPLDPSVTITYHPAPFPLPHCLSSHFKSGPQADLKRPIWKS